MPLLKPTRGIQLNRSHPHARGLVGCWLFNEGCGSQVADLSGYGLNMPVVGGTPEWMGGSLGPAMYFDSGDSEYMELDIAPVADIPCTMLAWICPDVVTQGNYYYPLYIANSGLSNQAWGFLLNYGYSGEFSLIPNIQISNRAVASKALTANTWHQIVGVVAGITDRRCYVDGGNKGTNTNTENAPSGLNRISIGCAGDSTPGYYFPGKVGCVMVWNRVLTDEEIAWLYREPFAMFERGNRPVSLFVPGIVELAGVISAQSEVNGRLTSICRVLELERLWHRDALFGGMTANAFKLGTVLTGSWFWTRVNSCTALYCGESMEQIDFENILTVSELDVAEIKLPTYISHDMDSTYFYLVRRFNKCGLQERTIIAAAKVSLKSDCSLKEAQPNKIYAAKARQTDGDKIKLLWFYCPLEQKSPPVCFRIYSDNASGQIDFENPLATIEYQGRKFYSYETPALQAGHYLFAVRVESNDGFENESQAQFEIQLDTQSPEPIDILETQIV